MCLCKSLFQSAREASLNLAVPNLRSVSSAANLALFEQMLKVSSCCECVNSHGLQRLSTQVSIYLQPYANMVATLKV